MNRRRTGTVAAALLAAAALAGCAPSAQNGATVPLTLVPAPASVEQSSGAPFRLTEETTVGGDPDAVATLVALLEARTGLTPAGGDGGPIDLRIEPGGDPESYRLTVDEASVIVTGADAAGLFHGVQTLGQLVQADGDGWVIPAVEIDDAPRFAYRGVMLDVARHFHSVDTVKTYIDHAATLKMNALHLHLSDDQGWRIQLHSRPELTELASGTAVDGDPGGFYTKDDYREIVEYAASRHMIVVPELDMPSHTHAIGLAYPELSEEPVITDQMRENAAASGGSLPESGTPYEGIEVGFSSLKIHDEATYDFAADVFGELAGMTPGPYLHLGGDEAHGTSDEDFALFVSRVSEIVADLGKTPIAWHEAGDAAGLDDSTIGQYWGFVQPTDGMDDKARGFVANGAQLILSPADAIYLDMQYPGRTDLGLAWANGPTSVQRAYEWDPASIIAGVSDSDILGIEAPLWSETLRSLDDIESMAFPRIAAAAEAGWSPAAGASDLRTWESFRERVGGLGPLWTSLGVGFFPSEEIDWVTE
jgi:N-acetyl-beta-hexosaminidase